MVRAESKAINDVIRTAMEDARADRMTDPDGGQIIKFMLQNTLDESGMNKPPTHTHTYAHTCTYVFILVLLWVPSYES